LKFDGPVDWFSNPTYNKYGEWTWQLSRHPEIQNLALAYKVTGDERYADGAVELLLSWIRQATRPEDGATRGETLCWRTIEAGIRMLASWPDIIHALIHSPAFTDEVILDLFKSVYEHGHRLITCFSHGNWLIMELCGVINICVLYPYFTECDEWVDEMLEYVFENKRIAADFINSEIDGMSAAYSRATYLLWIDISGVAEDSVDFCEKLRESTGLYLSDGAEYGECGRSFVRMNLATQRERVLDGLERLKRGAELYKRSREV
jgi:hypothetical protein